MFLKVGIPLNMNMTYKTICISSGCNLEVPTILLEKYLKQSNDIITFTTSFYSKLKSPYGSKSKFKGAILDTYNNN